MTFRRISLVLISLLAVTACKSTPTPGKGEVEVTEMQDPNLWLEEVEGSKALDFSRNENKRTLEHFRSDPNFKSIETEVRKIVFAKDRVPGVSLNNGELYNFWQDQKHVRGLWRKTSIQSYKTAQPKWEVILDLDELAKSEKENWVWKGANFLQPQYDRVLITLSRGGKDASVIREFDLKTKKFVAGGFNLPEGKSDMSWVDGNSVYVAADFGPGTLTDSGYPRMVKLWKRGTPLSEAELKVTAEPSDVRAYSYVLREGDKKYRIHMIGHTFYSTKMIYEDESGQQTVIPMPDDAEMHGVYKGFFLYLLRTDLKSFKMGSLVALPIDKLSLGAKSLDSLQLVFAPTEKKFLASTSTTRNYLLLNTMDNVLGRIEKVSYAEGVWKTESIDLGSNGVAEISSTEDESDLYLAIYVDFLTPSSSYVGNASDSPSKPELLKQSPKRFDSENMQVQRFEATSRDGTKIPYFVVSKKSLELNGKNPTLQYGYGGFEIAEQPFYLSYIGKVWLERGGVYVMVNLRGGGEFGPQWHQSVIKENRYKVYEDNVAVSEDLIARGITSPQHLGIEGGSNGGLLVGATVVLRPDLYNAVVCEVPLLDMLRYHKLLAGASWMGEYGNPDDPKMREAILKYSPYQRLSPAAKYPEIFVLTSTKDDRVHPGHARKFVARMKEHGHPVYYYENIEGGHAGSANLEQKVLWSTLTHTYLWEKLR